METPVKPNLNRPLKLPSKNQIIMERLKASIKAEKNRPVKKEIQSKVATIIRTSPNDKNLNIFSRNEKSDKGINYLVNY